MWYKYEASAITVRQIKCKVTVILTQNFLHCSSAWKHYVQTGRISKKTVNLKDTHWICLVSSLLSISYNLCILHVFWHRTWTVEFILHHLHWKHVRMGYFNMQQEGWLLQAETVSLYIWANDQFKRLERLWMLQSGSKCLQALASVLTVCMCVIQ